MNILKKVSAAVLAAVTAASCLTAAASAEDEKPKLLVSPMSVNQITGDLAATDNGFISVTDKDIEKWQTTGEFSYSDVKTDFDLPGEYSWYYEKSKNTGYLYYQNTGEDRKSLFTLKYDPKSKQLTKLKDFGKSWGKVSPDGYVIISEPDSEAQTLKVTITSPEGKSNTNTFEYKGEGDWWYTSTSTDKYPFVLFWVTDEKKITREKDNTLTGTVAYDIYGITRDGKVETLYSRPKYSGDKVPQTNVSEAKDSPSYGFGYFERFYDPDGVPCGISWYESLYAYPETQIIHFDESGENYEINRNIFNPGLTHVDLSTGRGGDARYSIYGAAGDKIITRFLVQSNPNEYKYVLFDKKNYEKCLAQNKDYEGEGKPYKSMSTQDGKIFLVQDDNDKWGYIDANVKELAMFDDAGAFVGDYAPVIKDGKAYLIDRNMKQFSEKTDAEGVTSVSGNPELFTLKIDGKRYLATYAKPAAEDPTDPTEPTDPTDPTNPTEPSEPTKPTDPQNPDTGAAGIGFTAALAAIGGAVMILSRKKR